MPVSTTVQKWTERTCNPTITACRFSTGFQSSLKNVQAHVALQIDVRMVNLLRTLDLRRLMRETLADRKCEVKSATLVHALVGFDSECEVKGIIGVWEVCFHGAR
jgi:hypothetical protein